jgi:uncharacterized membrane protein YphA (DoxX/SURF4 family)
MKVLNNISRLILGILFIFSGFVKAIDPLGSSYKFNDYFEVWGLNGFEQFTVPLAICLSSAEFIIGICLFWNIRTKIAIWAALFFMIFFTILTFYIALFNPVTDCGCFGDAIKLSNWQTFFKNLIIFIPLLIIFINRKTFKPLYKTFTEWLLALIMVIIIVGLSVYCLNHLPLIDFRPYKIGTYIPAKMEMPANAAQDVYKTIIYYEKNGVKKGFSIDNLPDSTWKFVKTESKLIKKGYEPPIHDFSIISPFNGQDITNEVLNSDDFWFILIAYDLKKSFFEKNEIINKIYKFSIDNGYHFICLTSSLSEEIDLIKNKYNFDFEFYNTDPITLKTIIRSNPGLVLLKNGTVISKWHYNDLPDIKEFSNGLLSYVINSKRIQYNRLLIISLSLGLLLIIALVNIIIKKH